jgi:hypothetical protein
MLTALDSPRSDVKRCIALSALDKWRVLVINSSMKRPQVAQGQKMDFSDQFA